MWRCRRLSRTSKIAAPCLSPVLKDVKEDENINPVDSYLINVDILDPDMINTNLVKTAMDTSDPIDAK